MIKTIRQCKQCNKNFIPIRIGNRHKGYFCSLECSTQNKKDNRAILTCIACGKSFNMRSKNNKYCSRKCLPSIAGEKNIFWKGGQQEDRKCIICKNTFQSFKSQPKKTCSPVCAKDYAVQIGKAQQGENNPNYRGGKERKCKVCSKTYWEAPSLDIKYCSRECFFKDSFLRTSPRWQNKRWGGIGSKKGTRSDIGIYVRSSWEANYARYLNFLQTHGEIVSWLYEKETFEFPVKKGTRFYTPDFKVTNKRGEIEYHEVKGYMTQKGKTALTRMAKYYPHIKIVLIQKKEYGEISKIKAMIPLWE